jgi:hypothetical protein
LVCFSDTDENNEPNLLSSRSKGLYSYPQKRDYIHVFFKLIDISCFKFRLISHQYFVSIIKLHWLYIKEVCRLLRIEMSYDCPRIEYTQPYDHVLFDHVQCFCDLNVPSINYFLDNWMLVQLVRISEGSCLYSVSSSARYRHYIFFSSMVKRMSMLLLHVC